MSAVWQTHCNMNAVAYLRTSSATNVGDGKDSPARQLLAINAYAATNSLSIAAAAVFSDEGVSGTVPLLFRPGWRKLMDHCDSNGVKVVVFRSLHITSLVVFVLFTLFTRPMLSRNSYAFQHLSLKRCFP